MHLAISGIHKRLHFIRLHINCIFYLNAIQPKGEAYEKQYVKNPQ